MESGAIDAFMSLLETLRISKLSEQERTGHHRFADFLKVILLLL
jgi:hypothetical protein